MRVVISSHGVPFDTQIRAYAEYRLFSTLAAHDNVLGARVRLRRGDDAVQCNVHVTLRPFGSVHARSSATHAAAAIDRAAGRIAALMDEQRLSLRHEGRRCMLNGSSQLVRRARDKASSITG